MKRKTLCSRLLLCAAALIGFLPFPGLFAASFQEAGTFSLSQYFRALFQTMELHTGFWNSFGNMALLLLFHLPVSLLAAFGLSRYRFPGKKAVYALFFVLALTPFQAVMVPQYYVLDALGLLNSRWAVLLPGIFSTLSILLLVPSMRRVNDEILDSARLDGLGEISLLWRFLIPLCKPSVAAVLGIQLFQSWSAVEQPLIFLQDTDLMPLAVLLNRSNLFVGIAPACGVLFTVLPLLVYRLFGADLAAELTLPSGKEAGFREESKLHP